MAEMNDLDQTKIQLLKRMFEDRSVSRDQMHKISGLNDVEIDSMIANGLIESDESYFGVGIHYFPTRKAKRYLKTHGVTIFVPPPKGAPLKNEMHDEALRNMRLKFEDMGYKTWQSERCLRQRGMVEFTPDGILEIGRRKIAIELEFSRKTDAQYKAKFDFYEKHPAIDMVIYFVGTPHLREVVLSASRSYRKIFVVLHKNFTQHAGNSYIERGRCACVFRLWKVLEVISRKRFIEDEDLRAV